MKWPFLICLHGTIHANDSQSSRARHTDRIPLLNADVLYFEHGSMLLTMCRDTWIRRFYVGVVYV